MTITASPHGGRLIERVAGRKSRRNGPGLAALPKRWLSGSDCPGGALISPMGFSRLWRGSWARQTWMQWRTT